MYSEKLYTLLSPIIKARCLPVTTNLYFTILLDSQNLKSRNKNYVRIAIEFPETYSPYNVGNIFFPPFLWSTIEFSITWNTIIINYVKSYKWFQQTSVGLYPDPLHSSLHLMAALPLLVVLLLPEANTFSSSEACPWAQSTWKFPFPWGNL